MATLQENLRNRIRKLPKPGNAAQALKPFFEAVSNAFMAIDDQAEALGTSYEGRVSIVVQGLGTEQLSMIVRDNGIGLDQQRFKAFCTVDTDYKEKKGGKGVGRLFWLDAFSHVEVESRFLEGDVISTRAFKFELKDQDQITDIDPVESWPQNETGTVVRLHGVSFGPYKDNYPPKARVLQGHFVSEFIANFLSGAGTHINLTCKGKHGVELDVEYPSEIQKLVMKGPVTLPTLDWDGKARVNVIGYLCDKQTSRGLPGKHHVHLLGNGRTVETRKIDDLLGITSLSDNGNDNLSMHLVVSSDYLDQRTSESRTAFTMPETDIAALVKLIVEMARKDFIAEQVKAFDAKRRASFDKFLEEQPIFGYGKASEIFASLPTSATSAESFASALAIPRMRAERKREERLQHLVNAVVTGDKLPVDFPDAIRSAAAGIHENERSALAHHAARRRVVLDLLDVLIRRVRERDGKEDVYHLEKTLHSLLAPMQYSGAGHTENEPSSHDLWILDERLAFTAGFTSDVSLRTFVKDNTQDDRPDLVLWDTLFGLGSVSSQNGDELVDDVELQSKVFIVELKHPGRKSYGPEENVQLQVQKYVKAIRGGQIEGVGRRPIKVSSDCRFHCTIVADFVGGFETQIASWDYIHNRAARQLTLKGDFEGVTIDALPWDYVLRTARENNRALLDAAGMKRHGQTVFQVEPSDAEDKSHVAAE
ncbi:hypothetical protein [Paracoccus fontiphilus]|uniref:Histidine kinase-, DNA gyrase B-, and HSP90-like ATPase n=1 Tax=Paracoccus fontiphilus TaxID=1815556 RepID=A0ABV7I7P6_9RHOB|nr:hypothetical protein [Paracoccus fontiphilus]